mgnify:CR=1 FL=1
MPPIRNRRLCRHDGWGRASDAMRLDDRPQLKAYLDERLGRLPTAREAPPRTAFAVEPSRIPDEAQRALVDGLGADAVSLDDDDRVGHSLGRSYRDLLRIWSGRLDVVTDAVVYPANEDQVALVLQIAAAHDLAVVPFGGGTSVVGGVDPWSGDHRAVITLDTMRLDHVEIDETALLADIGAGALGPDLERALNARGFTLGHFPQSFEFSTFGGWVATRGAGQQSTRYGKIEKMIQSVRLVAPGGAVQTRNVPATAAGPSLVAQLVGSEGTLGVITSAAARIRRRPAVKQFATFFLPDFERGSTLLRELEQAELPLSVVRLSDAEETRFLLRASEDGPSSLITRIGKSFVERLMRQRRFRESETCIALLSLEGEAKAVKAALRQVRKIGKRVGGIYVGSGPGRKWEKDRFRHPYLRDELLARQIMVDTLETATTWSNLPQLYRGVREAIERVMGQAGQAGIVLCHLSHVYPTGSSLYYTFFAPQVAGEELAQWEHVKRAATEAIIAGGGTLTHHHGIGNEHLPLSAEHGAAGVAALSASKDALDPRGIMNPGKLLVEERPPLEKSNRQEMPSAQTRTA